MNTLIPEILQNTNTQQAGIGYCPSLVKYQRRESIVVNIGDLPMGGSYPIRIQSMTTVDTLDTEGSIAQAIRMANAGCEYIRITAPSVKEAANLDNIRKGLKARGYHVPLVADIHFTPNAAELAARLVEKVRINPGNYADRKKFETIDYSEAGYMAELERIRERFIPLVKICKDYGTAMRIGTNHGSLSDRILSRYGDTPLGMVESALEFVRICHELNYDSIVLSMKASNTQVMVQAYRLLVQMLDAEGLPPYPLHLGVTEAGEGEDGRIKSAVGIGTLLEDGLGDTVRVSLTEDPEFEIPVARTLVERYNQRPNHAPIPEIKYYPINPFQHFRRKTDEINNLGGSNVPRVIADFSRISALEMADLKGIGHHYLPLPDKWTLTDLGADFVYLGKNPAPFMLANGSRQILDSEVWASLSDSEKNYSFPLFGLGDNKIAAAKHPVLNFLQVSDTELERAETLDYLLGQKNVVLVLTTQNRHAMAAKRRAFVSLIEKGINHPVIIRLSFPLLAEDTLQLYAATDAGGLLVDGLGDGLMIDTSHPDFDNLAKTELLGYLKQYNNTAFGILQAARTRMSKTEYISCPSCGRTLFDLQETTALIRKQTDHLKGLKIGIMGCIVNGPGEMADSDYGYVGIGKGKIALYKGQDVVKKSVPEAEAVNELINLIKENGQWIEAGQEAVSA